MDMIPDPWGDPAPHIPKKKNILDSRIFNIIFAITWVIAVSFFIISVWSMFSPAFSSKFSEPVPIYFFILLLPVVLPNVPVISLITVMVILYSLFFMAMLFLNPHNEGDRVIDKPFGYFAAMGTLGFLLTIVITLIENFFGVGIGGTSIQRSIQQHPYLSYASLIYAPFAEELGFRIIPLGILSVIIAKRRNLNRISILLSMVIPGVIKKKHGIKFGKADYILITITSMLFGYAHIFFGAWDWGKFVTAALVGVILAFGFLKFGLYVDIPIHWMFNGFLEVQILNPNIVVPIVIAFIWIFVSGISAIILLILIFIKRKGKISENPPVTGFSG